MVAHAAAAWIVLAVVFVIAFSISFILIKALSDPVESHPLSTLAATLSITTVLLCVLALPVDVYLVSSAVDYSTGRAIISQAAIADRSAQMQLIYNVLYIALIAFSFLVIPFAYFYYEEEEEDATVGQKVAGALKFTVIFVIAFAVLIAIGLVLKPSQKTSAGRAQWINDLLDTSHRGQGAIFFIVAVLMMMGTIGWAAYGAYGVAAWPLAMIKGRANLSLERTDVNSDLSVVRAKTQALKHKRSQTAKDRAELLLLEKKERLLSGHATMLETKSVSWVTKVGRALQPFRILIGCLLALLGLFCMVSLLLTSVDRAKNSPCGIKCGWTLNKATLPNPLDLLLVQAHRAFPLDLVLFTAILLFLVGGVVSGMTRVGIRFAWILLYRVRSRRTAPQGVLLMALILNFLILTLNMQVLTLAPQYATFGHQSYDSSLVNGTAQASRVAIHTTPLLHHPAPAPIEATTVLLSEGYEMLLEDQADKAISKVRAEGKAKTGGPKPSAKPKPPASPVKPCQQDAPDGTCATTRLSHLVAKVSTQMPFFGLVFFAQNWLVLAVFIVGFLYNALRPRPAHGEELGSSDEEIEF